MCYDDENDKVTVHDDVINIKEGDEENNEENERSGVDRNENKESSIVLGNKAKVFSKEKQNEITRLNEPRVTSEHILERVNTKFQHKHKPKEASANSYINQTIVENSNESEGNVALLKDKFVSLKIGNPSVGNINKDYTPGALEQ